MTQQMPKIRQAALLLLDAGFDHTKVARLFRMTEAQVRDLCLYKVENGEGQQPAKSHRAKLRLRSIPTHSGPIADRFCEKDKL